MRQWRENNYVGFIGSLSMKRTAGTGQGLNTSCKDICTLMNVGIKEGASSGGRVIDARLLQLNLIMILSAGCTTFPMLNAYLYLLYRSLAVVEVDYRLALAS
jgi:hypothetical protein